MVRCHSLGVSGPDSKVLLEWEKITSMTFHHEALTGNAMINIWRALLAEHARALKKLDKITERGEEVVKGVSKEIVDEFQDVCKMRNRLVHASWSIGLWSPFEGVSRLGVEKYQIEGDGLSKRNDLPIDFDELYALGTRCLHLSGKLSRLLQFYEFRRGGVERVFAFTKNARKFNRWRFSAPPVPLSPKWPQE